MIELLRRFVRPVRPQTRRDLAAAGARLDPALRTPHQIVGQAEEGCGATIGAMPECDFGCKGCYLGQNANATPPLPLAAIKAQMRALRGRLGVWGNLQLTDGEVTLRPEAELIELLRYARSIELIPMLMTHGESFRRRPGLLERLMVEGGLAEVSIHVDVLQRGRNADYARAASEAQLMPLRAEFARMIRAARRATGRPLRVASTCTVTPQNLGEVPQMARWFRDHADAFRFLAFQPAAQIGRSRPGVGGHVTQDDVWEKIAQGLLGDAAAASTPDERRAWIDRQWWFGHPDCSRLMTGLSVGPGGAAGGPRRYEPLGVRGDERYAALLKRFLPRFGGVSFRSATRPQRAAQLMGMALRSPQTFLWHAPRAGWRFAGRMASGPRVGFLAGLARGRVSANVLSFSTHAFMSRAELETPKGRERVRNCIFTVPIDGELVSMCEVNALGLRDRLYDRAAGRDPKPNEPLVALTVGAG